MGKIFAKKHYNFSWDFLRRNRQLRFLKNLKKLHLSFDRSSHSEVFLEKGILKICSKFAGEHSCRSVTSIKLLCNCIEITLRYGCSPVNWLHIFRIPFSKNTSEWLLLSNERWSFLRFSRNLNCRFRNEINDIAKRKDSQ